MLKILSRIIENCCFFFKLVMLKISRTNPTSSHAVLNLKKHKEAHVISVPVSMPSKHVCKDTETSLSLGNM